MIIQVNRNQDLLKGGVNTPKRVVIHNVHVLDASGSMRGGKYRAALEGINNEIINLQADDGGIDYRMTVVEFDSGNWRQLSAFKAAPLRWQDVKYAGNSDSVNILPHYWITPLERCGTINGYGAHGGTPLYYSVWEVLTRLAKEMREGESAVVSVLTDGAENNSPYEFSTGVTTRKLIEQLKEKGINVTFSGTQRDMDRVHADTGISYMNMMAHEDTGETISTSYQSRTSSLKSYAKDVARGCSAVTNNFFANEAPKTVILGTDNKIDTTPMPEPRVKKGRGPDKQPRKRRRQI